MTVKFKTIGSFHDCFKKIHNASSIFKNLEVSNNKQYLNVKYLPTRVIIIIFWIRFFSFFKDVFVLKVTETERAQNRQGDFSLSLVFSQGSHNDQRRARSRPGASSGSLLWVAGVPKPGPFSTAFPRSSVESWSSSGQPGHKLMPLWDADIVSVSFTILSNIIINNNNNNNNSF